MPKLTLPILPQNPPQNRPILPPNKVYDSSCKELSCKVQVSVNKEIEAFIHDKIPKSHQSFKIYAAWILKHKNMSYNTDNKVNKHILVDFEREYPRVSAFLILCYKEETVRHFRNKKEEPKYVLYKNYQHLEYNNRFNMYTMYSLAMDTDLDTIGKFSSITEDSLSLVEFKPEVLYQHILPYNDFKPHTEKIISLADSCKVDDKYEFGYVQYTYSCEEVYKMTQQGCIQGMHKSHSDTGETSSANMYELRKVDTDMGRADVIGEIKLTYDIIVFINKEDNKGNPAYKPKDNPLDIFSQKYPFVKTVSILQFKNPSFLTKNIKPKYVIYYKPPTIYGTLTRTPETYVYSLVFNTDFNYVDNSCIRTIIGIERQGDAKKCEGMPTLIKLIKDQRLGVMFGGKKRTKKKRMNRIRFSKGKKLIPRPRSRRSRTSRK